MATRPDSQMASIALVNKVVKSGSTVTKGVGVKVSSGGELEVDLCAAGDNAEGVAMATVVGDGVKTVEVALLCGGGIIPIKIAGTVTAGDYLECGTGGFVSRTLGGGTTVRYIQGKATQSGVTGDFIGLAAGQFAGGSS